MERERLGEPGRAHGATEWNLTGRNRFRELLRETFTADLRSLALMRILTGACVAFDVLYRARDLEAHYTDAGVLSTETARALVVYFG